MSFDSRGLPLTESRGGQQLVSMAYDLNGRLQSREVTRQESAIEATTYEYDACGPQKFETCSRRGWVTQKQVNVELLEEDSMRERRKGFLFGRSFGVASRCGERRFSSNLAERDEFLPRFCYAACCLR
jgi:YD repeat-containing protein